MGGCSRMPEWMSPFFWDTNIKELDIEKNSFFIIERLLNEGDHLTLKWLFETYPVDTIKETVKNSRRLSIKTARCWQNYFCLREEEMTCLLTSSTKPGRIF